MLVKEMDSLSGEVEKAINDSSDQTVENLTRIDTILSNIADIIGQPDVMLNATDNQVRTETFLHCLMRWSEH